MVHKRSLPTQFNPLLAPEKTPPVSELVERRRLGQTKLVVNPHQIGTSNATRPENLGRFDYAHLRVDLPRDLENSGIFNTPQSPPPVSYFLMRRSSDGYISATGMFKASFPWASHQQEEAERKYIKGLESTSHEETAGNVWIPPQHALELAQEYKILGWIQALLDPTPIDSAGTQKAISPPPKFVLPKNSLLPPPTGTPTTAKSKKASRRSKSPTKNASPAKKNASPRKQAVSKAANATHAHAASASLQAALDSAASVADSEVSTEGDSGRVEVDSKAQVNGDVETKHTKITVEVPSVSPGLSTPQSTDDMIAKAKEMVEDALKADGKSNKKSKRKAEDLGEEDEATPAGQKAKKAKVAEQQVKKQTVKTRALIGLSATLAIGAAIPYFL